MGLEICFPSFLLYAIFNFLFPFLPLFLPSLLSLKIDFCLIQYIWTLVYPPYTPPGLLLPSKKSRPQKDNDQTLQIKIQKDKARNITLKLDIVKKKKKKK